MFEKFLKLLVSEIIGELSSEKAKLLIDKVLDKVENKVEATKNKIDDAIILPLIKKFIREPFGIEDND